MVVMVKEVQQRDVLRWVLIALNLVLRKAGFAHEGYFRGGVNLISITGNAAILVRRYAKALSSLPEVDGKPFLRPSPWPFNPNAV